MVLVTLQEMTRLGEVIINSPLTVSSDATVTEAILQMSTARASCSLTDDTDDIDADSNLFLAEARASCVLVVDRTKVLGIFTERDVIHLRANGYQLTQTTITNVMTQPVITLRQSDFTDIFAALNLLQQHHIRHLPIVDDNDQLIGLVTHESLRQMLRPIDLLRLRLVSEIMNTDVICAAPETSVLDLTRLMAEHRVSSVVIVAADDDTRAIGIVTERDIVQFHALDLSFDKIKALEVMSSPLFTVSPDDSLWEARSLMQEKQLNRVVVTDNHGQLLGIVTQTTLLQALNPVEIYKLVETLEQKLCRLEKEKLELLENRNAELEQEVEKRTAELRNQAEKEKLLSSIASRIRSSLDLQQTLNAIVNEVRTFLQCDRVFIYQFNLDWTGIIVAESVIENHESFLNQVIHDPCFAANWIDPYLNGRVRVVTDIYQANLAPCHIELLEQIKTRAKILVPIVQERQLWGLLSATQKDHPRDWQELEVNLLQQLATQIGISIQQADIYRQLKTELAERKQAQADLQALVEGAAAVTGKDFFSLLLEYITTFLGYRYGLIATKNGEYYQTAAFWVNGNIQTNISGLLEGMPCNLTIKQGNFCCICDLQQHFPNETFKELAAESYVGVAIKSTEGETLGSLCVLDDKPLVDASRAIAILQVFAARVGAELERQQAMTALEQLNQELELKVEERTAELRQSQERWELALRGSNDGIWDWNIKTNQVFYSTRWKQMRGFADDEIGSHLQEWSNLIHGDDYDRVMIALADHLAHKTPFFQEEYRVQRKDGSYMWVLDRRQAWWDEQGNILRMVGSESDITSRKQAEAELLAITSLQQAIFNGIDYSVIFTNPEGIIQTFNAAAEKMLGYTAKEVIGKFSPLQFHDQDELQQQAATISEIWGRNITPGMGVFLTTAIQGIPHEQEWTYIRKDGSRFPVLLSVTTLYDDQQQIIGFVGIAKDITAKKQADEKLRRTIKELSDFKYALDQAAIVAITDSEGTITYANEKFSQISQYSPTELIGHTHKLVNSGYHSREFFAELWSTISSGNVWRGEVKNRSKDGSYYWVDTTIVPFLNDQGKPVQYLAIRTDITARKQAEIALQESQRFAQSIADSSPNILYIHDFITQQNLYINREITTILGYTPADLLRMGFEVLQQTFHPEDLIAYFAHQQQLQTAADDEILEIEYRVRNVDGKWRWLSARDAVFKRDVQGQVIQYIGVAQDITERKEATAALEKYAREVEDLYNNAPCGYYSLDSEGIITGINNTQLQWLGYTREEIVGRKYIDFLTQEGRQIFNENYPKFKEIGFIKDLEYSLIRKDGTVLPVLINATAVNSADGTYLHSRSTVFDITDRREAEKKLKHQLTVIEAAVDGIAILENNIFTYVNQAHLQLFGYEHSAELLGKNWQQLLYSLEESSRFEQEVFPILMQQRHWQGEAIATRKDGSTFHEGLSLTLTEGGTLICVCRDISDVKKAEQELRTINERLTLTNAELERATRLKDEFLANMSHELRTPLNAILGMSEGLQEEVFGSINPGQRKAIATIERSGRHLLELINDILDLSKIESGKLELQLSSVPVKNLTDTSLPFVRQQAIKKNIRLTVSIPDHLGEIVVDELRICQVLINLLNNAIKFTHEGGNIRLEIKLEGAYLVISVIDTGIGIASDDASKLFKPFVQVDSKLSRQYSGTGLGLALVRRLVELHDGTVGVTSELGKGSCFTVKLPYLQPSKPEMTHPTVFPQCSLSPENTKVLIIEDTPTAAEQVKRYLDEIGMEGVVYPQGEGAIAQILAHQPAFIILDIQLPHRSGWEVLQLIKAHPETQTIPVIIFSVVDERSRGIELGAAEYLIKPIIRQQFHQVINQLRQPSITTTNPENITVEEVSPPNKQSPVILIAEDNEANIDTISNYLESRGYRLLVAQNGQEAIKLAKTHAPDLILMDIQMPHMDGLEATRLIRADQDLANIPIIALTGLAMPSDQEKCLQAGANEYLTKPVRLKQLTEIIHNLLNK
ncbi:MAG: hypothetical protein RLZZ507_1186 [Cyanobacteriota bacterium]|jgi:PAS domain S-box-containing protein